MEINKTLNKDEIDVVIYHDPCSDGFGSAFVVWHYYKIKFGMDRTSQISFIPGCYSRKEKELSQEFLEKMVGKNILMCDFSYPYPQLARIINVCKSFLILDHHKTALADLKEIPTNLKIFDMDRSGVGITWDYFYPEVLILKFLAHIQDRDIWTYKLPNTHEFIAFFYEQKFDFNLWETFMLEENVNKAIDIGSAWLEYQQIIINNVISKTSYVIQEIDNKYAIVLYCNTPELKSDIGIKVFNRFPMGDFSAVWDYNLYKNQSSYSLRSTNDRYDVSEIAKKFGGGGHRNASGLILKGCSGCLPFKMIEDPGILLMLLYGTKGTITMRGRKNGFTLFKVKEIRREWSEQGYFELIKRKTKDTPFIVFETPSQKVKIDTITSNVIQLRDYTLFFNEMSIEKPELKLQYMVCGNGEGNALVFTSDKDFADIFSGSPQNNMDDNDDISDDGTASGSD